MISTREARRRRAMRHCCREFTGASAPPLPAPLITHIAAVQQTFKGTLQGILQLGLILSFCKANFADHYAVFHFA